MASRRRKLPVRPSSQEHNSASVSGQLHEQEPDEFVTLKYPDNAEQHPLVGRGATTTLVQTDVHESVGVKIKTEPVEEPRRSSRKRNSKSALELLGITPKKEASSGTVHTPKKHRSKPDITVSESCSLNQSCAKMTEESATPKKVVSRGRGRPRKKAETTGAVIVRQNVSPREEIGSGDVVGNGTGHQDLTGNDMGGVATDKNGKGDAISGPIAMVSSHKTIPIGNNRAVKTMQADNLPTSNSVQMSCSGKEATSPETDQLTRLLIQLSSSANNGTEVNGVDEQLEATEMLQNAAFDDQTEVTTGDGDQRAFPRQTFVLVEANRMPEKAGSSVAEGGENETNEIVQEKAESACDDTDHDIGAVSVVDLADLDVGDTGRSLRVPRRMLPPRHACVPVTSDDLDNPERSVSGKRVKPMRQVVMTQNLQDIVDKLEPADEMKNHINVTQVGTGNRKHFTCKYCDKPLLDRHDFRRHIKKHPEVDYKPFICPLCGYRAQIRAQIARHINIHSDIKPYTCTECGKGFNFKQKLQLHMKYHRDERDEQCPLCEKAFHEHKTLKTHLLKIHNVFNMRELMKNLSSNTKEPIHIVLPLEMTDQLNMVDVTIPLTETGNNEAQSVMPRADTDSHQASDVSGHVNTIGDDTKSIMLSEQDIEQLGLSEVAEEATTEGATSGVESVAPKNVKKRNGVKKSVLYGTRKTNINTSRFKMGLLPIQATEAGVKRAAVFDPVTGKRKRFVNNQRVVSEEQVEPDLLVYCNVDTQTTASKVLFHCRLCQNKVFPSKTQFASHLEGVHSDIRAWKCHLCNYTCRLRTSLFVHQRVHSGVKDHICNVCGKGFLFRQKLKMHLKVHLNLREHQCNECEKCFNDKTDLKKHFRRVHIADRPYACKLCPKAYKDHMQLKRHIESHSDTKKHLCQHCNKFYRSKLSLSQHMKSHTCMFHCEICDKNFGSYSGFMAHKVMHDESYEGYVCDICSRVLHTKGSLCRHKLVAHSNERPFACSECPKNFKTKKDLKNHKYCHVSEKAFACEVCDYQCKRMDSLRVHMRRHAKVKPFQCETCGRQYTQKHALEVHLRHHTGITMGQCDICQRTFTTKYQLGVHIRRIHGPEAAYKHELHEVSLVTPPIEQAQHQAEQESFTVFMCEECNSVFLTQDSLAVHILAEHMKQGWVEGSTGTSTGCITEAPDAVIEVTTETSATDKNTALYIENGTNGTIETFVSINDPSSSQDKIVSLLQPLVERTVEFTEEQEEGEELVEATEDGEQLKPGTEHYFILNKSSDGQVIKDTEEGIVLAISESASAENQEFVVDGIPSALETLLAASELHQNEALSEDNHVAVAQTVEIPVTAMQDDGVMDE